MDSQFPPSTRWEESSELLCDPCPLVLDPLFTVQELYITLKVARKDMAYITGKGVLLGRVGFKELIGEGMPIAKGLGAYHDKETFKTIYDLRTPESWAGL